MPSWSAAFEPAWAAFDAQRTTAIATPAMMERGDMGHRLLFCRLQSAASMSQLTPPTSWRKILLDVSGSTEFLCKNRSGRMCQVQTRRRSDTPEALPADRQERAEMGRRRNDIHETLRRRVMSDLHLGLVRPGQRLASARETARELGTDYRVVVAAGRALEREGLLEIRPRA